MKKKIKEIFGFILLLQIIPVINIFVSYVTNFGFWNAYILGMKFNAGIFILILLVCLIDFCWSKKF